MENTIDKTQEILTEDKPKAKFVHLHLHSEYSLLDGATRIINGKKHLLAEACKKQGMEAVAITDHGMMAGVFTFQKSCIENGIKPIIGCEFYMADDMHNKSIKQAFHLILLAKNNIGYRNLVKMSSLAYTEGMYYRPRIDLNLLRNHSEGVICLSACLSGKIPKLLLNNKFDEAKSFALELKSCFEDGDFYIELQDHGIKEEKMVLPLLVKLARDINVKTVATNDVHYLNREDSEMHDVLLCIQTGQRLDDTNRMKMDSDSFYLKSYDEMMELFGWCPDAIENTVEIANKCNAMVEKNDLMPPFNTTTGETPEQYLRRIAYDGLVDRYGELSQEIKDRAEYELDIIIKMGFAEYYLIVWDFIRYSWQNDIPVGPGRGSGVGSIIAYAIGITNVEPLKFNLLFERFLNPERVSNPDFDIDFCVDGRAKVIDYVVKKYTSPKVCQILALGTLATKAAIKDVARVHNVKFEEVNKITKLIPAGKVKLAELLGFELKKGKDGEPDKDVSIAELISIYKSDDLLKKIMDMALKIEGMPKNASKHAAGVVICKEIISDFVPLCKVGEDITTQFQKDEVEEVGLLKMDFLGLRTLTDIAKAKKYIKQNYDRDIDFNKLGYDDRTVYDLISSGDTDAVFQIESGGMKKFMTELLPNSLEDIIAGVSLFRPGPMDSIPKYIMCKNDPTKIAYHHPSLEPILDMTYGCIVYQEQVMQIVQALAGYTYGRADLLRRAMGKKKADVMAKEKDIFINGIAYKPAKIDEATGKVLKPAETAVEGAKKRGVPVDIASIIFAEMEAFAAYAFNKSHAAAYSVITYETAFLKCYYPVEYITSVINNRIDKAEEVSKYVQYLKNSGVVIKAPDINESMVEFKANIDKTVRYGLKGIKNVGDAVILAIINEREKNGKYTSLSDMLLRNDSESINKRLIESLIKAGALDCFGETRATLMANYDNIINVITMDKRKRNQGMVSFFEMAGESVVDVKLKIVKEYDKKTLLLMEKEMTSMYITGHPLDEYRDLYKNEPFNLGVIERLIKMNTVDDEEVKDDESQELELLNRYNESDVYICGIVNELTKKLTKKNTAMMVGKIEDLYGEAEFVMFGRVYEKYKNFIQKDSIFKLFGKLNINEGKATIMVREIFLWGSDESENLNNNQGYPNDKSAVSKKLEQNNVKIYMNIIGDDDSSINEKIIDVQKILLTYPGNIEAFCQVNGKLVKLDMTASNEDNLIWELASILGTENIKKK